MPALVSGILLLGAGIVASRWFGTTDTGTAVAARSLQRPAPTAQGKNAFDANCASCHGAGGRGTVQGPPLVHDVYNPGHHDDASFYRAARNGVPQHHWPFGNMPAQPKVSDGELAEIIRYVRALQQANGIFYRPHTM
jgi:mono/diheme cytochrome c family protein